jgi:glycosyl transferase family 25
MPTKAGQALLDTFDRVRIINLKTRADRRREMAGELARLGLDVDGERIAFHEACRPEDAGTFPSIGARGCFTSHFDILQAALTSGAGNVLILEDDLDFARDAEERLPRALDELASHPWSIFYGGYEQYAPPPSSTELAKADAEQAIRTTHFLALSRNAIEAGVPYLARMAQRPAGDPAGGPMHVDGAYSWLRKDHPALETWVATPELGHQRPSRTDIHAPGVLDRMPVLRGFTAMGRRIKRQLGK